MKIRAIIVDDEPLARKKLKLFLADEPEFDVIAECSNGAQAISAIGKHRADVVFLDIQMPEIDGFGVLESLSPQRLPFIVFVTAHDAYALKAFEVRALDYLLKPYDRSRLRQTLSRVRAAIQHASIEKQQVQILSLLADLKTHRKQPERLLIRSAGRVYFVNVDDIEWAEAEGNYVSLHVGSESHLIRQTMSALEQRTDPQRFVRIHRSTLVNVARVKEIQPWFEGEYVAILSNGKRLNVSRPYRKQLTKLLEHHS